VTFVIKATLLADASMRALRGEPRRALEAKLRELKARGCEVCGYRLSGTVLDRICCVHLWGAYRLLACFPSINNIAILFVGEHDGSASDPYRVLAMLLELRVSDAPRTRPPCCDEEGQPPFGDGVLDDFENASRDLIRHIARRLPG
jgi:hypothetical protein